MECSTAMSNIEATAGKVREASFKEKLDLSDQEMIDLVLDKILEFKELLRGKINEIEDVIVQLEELTWCDEKALKNKVLKQTINDVISSARDWSTTLSKNYNRAKDAIADLTPIEEMEELKDSIDDLVDATNTLERAIFFYPMDETFSKITRELTDL